MGLKRISYIYFFSGIASKFLEFFFSSFNSWNSRVIRQSLGVSRNIVYFSAYPGNEDISRNPITIP